jgi:drug/metabolite transporter (DMT)-like permease
MKRGAWAAFWLVGVIWGSSFLLIRIGVSELKIAEVVFIRTFIGAVGLSTVIAMRRVPVPTDWPTLRSLIIIGIGNVVAPFLLITWSETSITSGLASVLQATAALFSLVVAHFMFADDRITPQKLAGLATGFIGVVVLFSGEMGGSNSLGGMFGMVLASLCYAVFTAYSRRFLQGNIAPVVVAGITQVTAAVVTGPLALAGGFTPLDTVSSNTLIAVIILGLVNTFVAYLFYYFVVRELGVSRASMVTYITPVVGVVLGAVFLSEQVGLTLVLGGGLIFAGIGIVNIKLRQRANATQVAGQGVK